jgi:hypothetical protein
MTEIILEFEKLEILRPKERWQLYFVIVAEHPTDPDKMVIGTVPSEPASGGYIRLKPREQNKISFVPEGTGADGLFVLEREIPADRRIKVRTYLRHSRQGTRNVGKILQDIKTGMGADAIGIVSNILGSTNPWLVIAKSAIPLVGKLLSDIKDRDFGFISMDEDFGPEFESQSELDRSNTFSTGDAKLVWSWSVK